MYDLNKNTTQLWNLRATQSKYTMELYYGQNIQIRTKHTLITVAGSTWHAHRTHIHICLRAHLHSRYTHIISHKHLHYISNVLLDVCSCGELDSLTYVSPSFSINFQSQTFQMPDGLSSNRSYMTSNGHCLVFVIDLCWQSIFKSILFFLKQNQFYSFCFHIIQN